MPTQFPVSMTLLVTCRHPSRSAVAPVLRASDLFFTTAPPPRGPQSRSYVVRASDPASTSPSVEVLRALHNTAPPRTLPSRSSVVRAFGLHFLSG